ncbi:hypothetical protein BDF20DRAFT_841795 [Mycotypha africana]|uniref:uncharacterized protein n=1 Tax=Mycotypha africana TaxID=64632 RepID=UPI002300C0D0|nr:uncharacterized protein BDF20DRAFT_841795 [Mycotypha africana]KAI8990944.1 hypothetical protein BDF20DRAFT_841795 [Mycotypha africana]
MSSWELQVTPQEVKYFKQLFQVAGQAQEGIVTGAEAVRFFAGSGVPNQILSEIWETADRDKAGYLTEETFAIALKLIACAQHGKEPNANVLSTVVPLPQFDGANGITPSPYISKASPLPTSASLRSAATVPSNNSEPVITPQELEKYLNIFKLHQPINGILDANTAKSIFIKSKLPTDVLGQIWNLADVRQSGTLNQTEFVIAMHYIAKLMDGTISTLPDNLSPAIYQSAVGSSNINNTVPPPPQSPLARSMTVSSPAFQNARQQSMMTPPQRARTIDSLGNLAFGSASFSEFPTTSTTSYQQQHWDVTAAEKQQFDSFFNKIDSGNTGVVQGKEAVEFFKNSRLPETDLAHIWDLADIQQRGALSRDEFAVAMHLIHKRLSGEALPKALPHSLIPPSHHTSAAANVAAAAFTPTMNNQQKAAASSARQPTNRSLLDDDGTNNADLLGDFADDKISAETNQLNLMQNQISSLSLQTREAKQQTIVAGNTLEQLLQQKKELEAQLTNVRMTHEAAVKDLNEIQETVRREEAEWNKVRVEYEAAQNNLTNMQNEVTQLKQTLENGRSETEQLRRRVAEIQEETRNVHAELDNMRSQTKQQGMMIDINRRQVTAAEQDRAQAKRHLEDYKVAANLTKDENDDGSSSNSDDNEDGTFSSDLPKKSPVQSPSLQQSDMFGNSGVGRSITNSTSPHTENSTMSSLALDNLFGISSTSPASVNAQARNSSSPFMESNNISNKTSGSDSFDLFASNKVNAHVFSTPGTASTANDFDAIFGSFASPSPTAASATIPAHSKSPSAASTTNDPMSWATTATSSSPVTSPFMTSPTAKSTRGPPPPPPPQSRHHRQPSESVSSIASGGAIIASSPAAASATPKRQRAPPPPPPPPSHPSPSNNVDASAVAPTSPASAAPASVFSSSSSIPSTTGETTTAIDQPLSQTNQTVKEAKKNTNSTVDNDDEDDDFEAAFSGKELSEAKIVTNEKDDEFTDFDDAFKVLDDNKNNNTATTELNTNAFTNDDWASAFNSNGGAIASFGSPSAPQNANTNTNDDWDKIFGMPSNVDNNNNHTDTPTSALNNNVTTNAAADKGFADAFASFGDDFGKSSLTAAISSPSSHNNTTTATVPSPQTTVNSGVQQPPSDIGIVGDKVEELVKMGFGEKEAKDALNRYDQNLEKASNFLLDQSSTKQ